MTERDRKLLHRVERCDFLDELDHKKTKQGKFDAAVWHLDHPIPGTDIFLMPSDRGEGAERVYAALEPLPLWQRLYGAAYLKLPSKGKKVLKALEVDWRTAVAAKIAGLSRPTIDLWKKKFRVHFAQCFRAWKGLSTG